MRVWTDGPELRILLRHRGRVWVSRYSSPKSARHALGTLQRWIEQGRKGQATVIARRFMRLRDEEIRRRGQPAPVKVRRVSPAWCPKQGPLRKIADTLEPAATVYGSARVRLDCGHETTSWGGARARCPECLKQESVRR